MSKPLRVIQVGLGGMGQGWLNLLNESEDVELVGLVDLRHEAALEAAEKVGLPPERAVTDQNAIVRELKPDAVVDITVPAAHKIVTLAALEAGCHVIGEKPLADSMDNAREMIATAEAVGKIYMVSQNYRWGGQVRAIRQAIADGLLGPVTNVVCDFFLGAHFGGFRVEMDHPLLIEMSIHHFDMMRCMTQAAPDAVYCHTFNPSNSWFAGDASASAIFEMSDGIVFAYRGSWCAEGRNTHWNGDWRIVGENGTIIWDGESTPVAYLIGEEEGFLKEANEQELSIDAVGPEGLAGSLERFVEAVRSGEQPETWCGDNIKSLAMVFGAIESAEKDERVEMNI